VEGSPAELVGEHEVVVGVGLAGEAALEQLRLPVRPQRLDRLGIQGDRAP
jgi:hypothetical protein